LTQRETDRQTYRQTDAETDRQRDRDREAERDGYRARLGGDVSELELTGESDVVVVVRHSQL